MKNCQIEILQLYRWSSRNYWCKTSLAPSRNSTTDDFSVIMDKALINNSEVTMKDESKEERFLRMIAQGLKSS